MHRYNRTCDHPAPPRPVRREVTLPCEEVPPELPEPALGINFAR